MRSLAPRSRTQRAICRALLWADAKRVSGDDAALRNLVRLVDDHPVGHIPPVLRAETALARIDLGDIEPVDIAATYERAISILRELPAPYNLAWALIHRGHDEDLIEAAAIAEQLGAQPLVQQAATRAAQPV